MAEEIRDLIEKINLEGIKVAEEKAQIIEAAAKQRADDILARAKLEAEEMIATARDQIRREDETGKTLLAQAGRDFLLSLRKEITTAIERLILKDVRQALGPDALHKIMAEVIKNYGGEQESEAVVSLRPEDAEALQKHYLARLKEETKKGIILKPSGEISGGFTISFDAGRSQFDFTDLALAEYIGTYLKPQLNEILKQAVSQ